MTSDSLDLLSVSELVSASSEDDARRRMVSFARSIGFDQALFGIEVRVVGQAPLQHITSGYREAYQRLYAEREFIMRDPTVVHAQTKQTPLVWTPDIFTGDSVEILEESRRHGLGYGLSIPIHESDRVVSMLSFGRDKPFDSEAEQRLVIQSGTLLATCMHVTMQNLVTERMLAERRPKLTPRETEVLKLITDGRSNWEIGQRLHISEAAAAFHVKNIFGKFDVRTRIQVVALAVALRMIS